MSNRKELHSIKELILDVGHRKSRAAQYRSSGNHSNSESSRKVYLDSCVKIASVFAPLGYKYTKKESHICQLSGDIAFQVAFQSSHHNIPGEYVALTMNVYVLSKTLENWRKQQTYSVRQTDYVAGGQIGGLLDNPAWLEWNLADPRHRRSSIEDAVKAIKEIALPYFAQFKDKKALIEKLRSQSISAMDIGTTVEFLLCFGYPEIAVRAGGNYLSHHPDLIDKFAETSAVFRKQGLPKYSAIGAIPELAFISVAHDLSFLDKA